MATATATARKMPVEHKNLPNCDYCDCLILFACWQSALQTELVCVKLNIEKYRLTIVLYCLFVCLSCHQNGKCGNFTLLLFRERHELVHKCVLHVRHAYFFSLDQSNP